MVKKRTQDNNWQNWALFSSRWLLIAVVLLVVYQFTAPPMRPPMLDDLLMYGAIAAVANLLLAPMILFKPLRQYQTYVLIGGDWIIAGVLSALSGVDLLLMTAICSVLISISLLRLGWQGGIANAVGILAAVGVSLALTNPNFTANMGDTLPALLVTLAIGGTAGIWVYFREYYSPDLTKTVRQLEQELNVELENLRDSNNAVIEMAGRLGSTLSYDKILDAALDVGRLSLSPDNTSRLVSLVMLFRAGKDSLYIENARGIGHLDEGREIAGKLGIVGEALAECIPIIGGGAGQDPELRDFIAFGNVRSTMCIPLRAGYDNYGVLIYGSESPDAFNNERISTLTAISTQVTVALQNAVLYSNLLEEKERLVEMEENGRKALVRDLHDIPTQTISALTMRVRIIQRLMQNDRMDEATKELDMVEEMAQRATEEIRHVLFKLRPLALESQGLSAALEQLAEKTFKVYKQKVVVRVAENIEHYLDQSAQGTVFYLIEEAVSNARKYAQAQQISVAIGRKNGVLIVRIADNGVGFDTGAVNSNYAERGSFGMVNMRERAGLVNGTLTLESAPGKGTVITVMIPLPERPASNGKDGTMMRKTQSKRPQTKLALSANERVERQLRSLG